MHYTRARRRELRAEPDRHARPRRLHLRGLAQPRRLRGRDARRRRHAGHRGADAGQRLPGASRTTSSIIPVINKIDLPARRARASARQIDDLIGVTRTRCCASRPRRDRASTRSSRRSSSACRRPRATPIAPLRALVFDSLLRPVPGRGRLRARRGRRAAHGRPRSARCRPARSSRPRDRRMSPGHDAAPVARAGRGRLRRDRPQGRSATCRVGDTLTAADRPAAEPLPGYREVKPMVFCGLFPVDADDYPRPARRPGEALAQRRLAALRARDLAGARLRLPLRLPRAAAHGHRAGAAGARVRPGADRHDAERRVPRHRHDRRACSRSRTRPSCRDHRASSAIEEPYVRCAILVPRRSTSARSWSLCQDRRGVFVTMEYLDRAAPADRLRAAAGRDHLDFYDQLKSPHPRLRLARLRASSATAPAELVKLDILLNGEPVDALSMIVHRDQAYARGKRAGRAAAARPIPRQLFEVPIQAAIGGKIIARETVKAMRKDVLAKCYGGDISRKRKLLEKQKEGKKRMKQVGQRRGAAGGVPVGAARSARTGGSAVSGVRHLYVHLPFCASRCGYCAFVVEVGALDRRDAYLDALLAELERESGAPRHPRHGLPRRRHADPDAPAPPRPPDGRHRARAWPRAPRSASRPTPRRSTARRWPTCARWASTRLSLGVQSFQPHLLARARPRRHRPAGARRRRLRPRGRLRRRQRSTCIFGVPGQTPDDLEADLAERPRRSRPTTSPGTSSRSSPGAPWPAAGAGLRRGRGRRRLPAHRRRPRGGRLPLVRDGQLRPARPRVPPQPGLLGRRGLPRRRRRRGEHGRRAALAQRPRARGATSRPPPRRRPAARRSSRSTTTTCGASAGCSACASPRPLDLAWAGPPDRPEALARLAALGLLSDDAAAVALTREGRFVQNAVLHELMEYA